LTSLVASEQTSMRRAVPEPSRVGFTCISLYCLQLACRNWNVICTAEHDSSLSAYIYVGDTPNRARDARTQILDENLHQTRRINSQQIGFHRAMHAKRGLAIARCPSVCLSVCDVGGSWPRRLKILETDCANN